jgi:hypothetical protein
MERQVDMAGGQNAHLYDDSLSRVDDLVTSETVDTVAPDTLPATQPAPLPADNVAAEFYIEHGNQQHAVNDDGESRCRKESMQIPDQRKNRFHDNGKAFADEKVTTHPDDPNLGIQSIRPRSLVRDTELGVNTGTNVAVVCGLCGVQEEIAASLAVGFNPDPDHNTYRCNECNTPNGRAKVMRKQRNDAMNGNTRPRR